MQSKTNQYFETHTNVLLNQLHVFLSFDKIFSEMLIKAKKKEQV